MPAAVAVRGRQTARERFQEGVRARVVPAGCDVERPACAASAASALESSGPTTRIRSKPAVGGRPANVSSKRSGSRFRSSHSSAPTPLRGLSDQLDATTLTFLPSSGSRPRWRVEDRRVDGVRDDDRLAQLEAELAVLRERELRLEDRRGRERGVDLGDPRVRAVVEPSVGADRPVDAVHHPRPAAREAPEPPEVEVERVEEAHGRTSGDRPDLDLEPATFELAHERAEELMPAPRGRRRELVEERDVGAAAPGAEEVDLGVDERGDRTPFAPRVRQDASRLHGDTLTSPGSMPSASRLLLAVRHRELPLRARVDLLRAETARRVRSARAYAVRVGPATVFLSEDDYEIDWASFAFVAVDDAYKGDYRDACVVDLGAHKGYYGAYAFRHGARTVVSYEPESTNASYLEAAAARLRGARTWRTVRAAVGAEPGEAACT